MKKRIYMNFISLILTSIIILSFSLCLFFYDAFKTREIASVKESAGLIADFLNRNANGEFTDYIDKTDTLRITVIAPDGTVLLDNKADASTMENHSGRAEVIDALQTGHGEATRYSSTLSAETYYYAVKLNNGNVFRLSKMLNSIVGVFVSLLPVALIVTAIIILFSNYLARRLTDNITKPLYSIDLDGDNAAVYDELSPYVKKINQQKLALNEKINELKARADTIEAITGNMKEGLILIDKAGLTLTANKSGLDIFGETSLTHRNILHICRDMEFQQGVRECLSGEYAEINFDRDGRSYDVIFSPVSGENEITGGVILFFDITEKHEAEKQRREFSANVSHELKTPLTTVSGLAELIANGMVKDEDIKSFADKILKQAKRLINIINDIIKLSEFDESKISTERTDFDLHELAETVIETIQPKACEKRVAINIVGGHFHIFAVRQMIDELLFNLIENAIKYNNEGGSVTVTLSAENGFAKIAVTDTGIGIRNEHQTRVFERFYRVDKSRSKKTGGTGLGLSIVKHITEYHGGKVELDSVPGEGTTVVCYINGTRG